VITEIGRPLSSPARAGSRTPNIATLRRGVKADLSDSRDGIMVVAGAGGFIGGHLVRALGEQGRTTRAIDIKPVSDWHQVIEGVENVTLDLSDKDACLAALDGADAVYNLACDMGGMGYIEANKARCMLSVLINTHLLMAAREQEVQRYFFASSACVYAAGKQASVQARPLAEADAYPAMPEDGYGWEKLFGERLCRHFSEDFGLETRVARYHNVYGPLGAWDGGREKAPAALCRKVAVAKLSGRHEIEVWGDGNQVRTFTHVDDCVAGTLRIMDSGAREPLNVGSDEPVTVNELVDMIEEFAGIKVKRNYVLDAPLGVRGRSSDNSLILEHLGWQPTTPLRVGVGQTYRWVYDQVSSLQPAPVA
jgi:GDP-D-mannose 3',5'-epimerase